MSTLKTVTIFAWALTALVASSANSLAQAGDRSATSYGQHLGLPMARDECPYLPTLTGSIDDLASSSRMDLAIAEPNVWVSHKLDIDQVEDQCIAEVLIQSKVLNRGCEFSLLFRSDGVTPGLQLRHAHFEADSFCPGWLDDREGTYTWTEGQPAPEITISPERVPDRVAERSCAPMVIKVNGDIRMRSGFKTSTFRLENVVITGQFDSVGDTDAICPAKAVVPETVVFDVPDRAPSAKTRFDAKFVGILGFSGGSYAFEQQSQTESHPNAKSDDGSGSGFNTTARYIPSEAGVEVSFTRLKVSPEDLWIRGVESFAFGEVPVVGIYRWDNLETFRPAVRLGANIVASSAFKKPDYGGAPQRYSETFFLPTFGAEADFKIDQAGYGRIWIDTRFQKFRYSELGGGFEGSFSFGDSFFVNAAIHARTRVIQFMESNDVAASVYEQLIQYRFEVGYFY